MPRLGKRKQHLKKVREISVAVCKKPKSTSSQDSPQVGQASGTSDFLTVSQDEPSSSGVATHSEASSDSDTDSDFDPDESLKDDPVALIEEFTADWISALSRDDLYSLTPHLHRGLSVHDYCSL